MIIVGILIQLLELALLVVLIRHDITTGIIVAILWTMTRLRIHSAYKLITGNSHLITGLAQTIVDLRKLIEENKK